MMRMLIVVAFLGGCMTAEQKLPRWPEHRKQHDSRLTELQTALDAQARVIAELTGRVTKLETERPGTAAVAPASAP